MWSVRSTPAPSSRVQTHGMCANVTHEQLCMHTHAGTVCVCVCKHISVRAVPQAAGMGVRTPAWVHASPFAQVLEEPHVCTGTCTLTQP